VHRGLTALRSASLVVLIGAGIPLAADSVASGSVNPPGQISVAPQTVVEGTAGNNITFTYISTRELVDGTVTVRVPRGWTRPNVDPLGTPGSVQTNHGKVSTSKRLITVKHVGLCESTCPLTLSYSDVAVPAETGTATFPTEVAKENQSLKPIEPGPTIGIIAATPCNEPLTTPGPPSLTVAPGECLSGGTAVSVTGSGFDSKTLGLIEECNDDANQPTVLLPAPIDQSVPVSCRRQGGECHRCFSRRHLFGKLDGHRRDHRSTLRSIGRCELDMPGRQPGQQCLPGCGQLPMSADSGTGRSRCLLHHLLRR
jgi:hypothetical protein